MIDYMKSLQYNHPEIASEWYQPMNGSITPSMITCHVSTIIVNGIRIKPYWQCRECSNTWQATVASRVGGKTKKPSGCPYCSGRLPIKGVNDFGTLYPELVKYWYQPMNGTVKPCDVKPNTVNIIVNNMRIKPYWHCDVCNGIWQCSVGNKIRHECPYCMNTMLLTGFNDLKSKCPDIASEWYQPLNGSITPDMVIYGSNRKITVNGIIKMPSWKCSQCGYIYDNTANKRVHGIGCPVCSNMTIIKGINDLLTLYPDIASEWYQPMNGNVTPDMVSKGTETIRIKDKNNPKKTIRVKPAWKCSECSHVWRAYVYSRTGSMKSGCPRCSQILHVSNEENEVAIFMQSVIDSHNLDYHVIRNIRIRRIPDLIKHNDNNNIIIDSNMEVDILIPELHIAFEFNGDYWHSDAVIMSKYGLTSHEYDSMKTALCKQVGIKLIILNEHDWLHDNESMRMCLRDVIMCEHE